MYLPFVSNGLKTYPGLPGTVLAVGNVGSVGEEGEELGFTLSAGKLLVVVLDDRPRLSAATAADLLRGSKRTETGFGYKELYAPLMASTVTPIGPPRRNIARPVSLTSRGHFAFNVYGLGSVPSFAYCNGKLVPPTLHKCRGRDTFLSGG